MTSISPVPARPDVRALLGARAGGASAARSPDGILTYVVPAATDPDSGRALEPLVVKVPTGEAAAESVHREALLLVELRRRRLGPVERTIPRHVGMRSFDGLPVALSSSVPGRPMVQAYRRGWHTAQPWLVRRDLQRAGAWLAFLHDASAMPPAPLTWPVEVAGHLQARWAGHPLLERGLTRLERAASRLAGCAVPVTVVHGDFCHDNVLLDGDRGAVTGVVNWGQGTVEGCPLRDLTRFALKYQPDPFALVGNGWYSRSLRQFLRAGLAQLGVPADCWFEVALTGVADVAAGDRDGRIAADHLAALASLPEPSRPVRMT